MGARRLGVWIMGGNDLMLRTFLAALLAVPLFAWAASYTPEVTITVPPGQSVKVTRRATNTSKDVLVTVNKGSKLTIQEAQPTPVPPVVVPPVVTPPPPLPSDFSARAAGAWRAWRFDSDAKLGGNFNGLVGESFGYGWSGHAVGDPNRRHPVIKTGALEFELRPFEGANGAGTWSLTFSDDDSKCLAPPGERAGCAQEAFVQVGVEWNKALAETQFRAIGGGLQAGIKFFDISGLLPRGTSDAVSGAAFTGTSSANKTVVQTDDSQRRDILIYGYGRQPSTGAVSNGYGWSDGFTPQNLMPAPGCTYPAYANCFNMREGRVWITYREKLLGRSALSDQFVDFEADLWLQAEGQPRIHVHHYDKTTPNYVPKWFGGSSYQAAIGVVNLFPYLTNKDPTQDHPVAVARYYDVIIGPRDPGPVGAAPVVTPPVVQGVPAWRQAMPNVGQVYAIPNSSLAYSIANVPLMFAGAGEEALNSNPNLSGIAQAWNGVAELRGSLYILASGGENQYFNASAKIDLNADAPRWSVVRRSISRAQWRQSYYMAEGSPIGRHTYNSEHGVKGEHVADGKDRVMLFAGFAVPALEPTPGGAIGSAKVDGFRTADGAWDAAGTWADTSSGPGLSTINRGTPGGWTAQAVDPRTSDVYFPGTDPDGIHFGLIKWTAKTGAFSFLRTTPNYPDPGYDSGAAQPTHGGHVGTFDTKRNAFVVINGQDPSHTANNPGARINRTDVATGITTNIPLAGLRAFATYESSVVYDPDGDRYIYAPSGASAGGKSPLYALNPDTGAETLLGYYPTPSTGDYTMGRMAYVDGFVAIVPDNASDVHILRTRKQ